MLDFKKIKYYYDNKLWTKEMVKNAVKVNKITEEQYKEITNEDYTV
ncbi:XkdX family protein [Romboutsia sp. 1001216sp1]|nr:XkdX family protein [Romboutsia sp. 1001216sp1]MDB8805003.1 XkdX family protein [Romboutsia sp. 1001216sp1]MDB8807993.1 XkdX family protein [Romboutsia sp. 1001216sp1]MDB8810648.1 XkdX family protein [Romboutsia sp. 1001216sp1]MDB8816368.1 XkdX family protein [Romboutsia sp. 1001216sp1]MDB8818679.1 XkdX family protein [Romboutsia sp. 1001216sp1]